MKTIDKIVNLLSDCGIDVLRYESSFFKKTLCRRMADTASENEMDYYTLLKENADESDYFRSALSVSYSEFFRNQLTFSVLEKVLLPGLLVLHNGTHRKELRVWSAACASGQEVYSLSMLLAENVNAASVALRVFATDYDEEQISIARKGEYGATALGNITLQRLNAWFEKRGNIYKIKDELKKNIEFSVFDLLDNAFSSPPASIFGDFDIIFCANVLFYYSNESRILILEKINKSLSDSGYLVTSETERDILLSNGFSEVIPHSAIFRKK